MFMSLSSLSQANSNDLECNRSGQWWLFKNLQDKRVSFSCGRVFGKVELGPDQSFLRDLSGDGWNDGMGFPPGTNFKCRVDWKDINGRVLKSSQVELPVTAWYRGAHVVVKPDYEVEVTNC